MRRKGWLIAAGSAAFLVFLVARIPAALLARWLPTGLTVQGWNGTIWAGQAGAVAVAGRPLGAASWSCHPSRLLRLEWSCHLTLAPAGGRLEADVAAHIDGTLVIHQAHGRLPLAPIAGQFAGGGWSGWLEPELDEVIIRDRWPVAIGGRLRVRGLASASPAPVGFGDFELVIGAGTVGAGPLSGRLRDLGAPLQLRATVELQRDRSYTVSGEAAPGPGAAPAILDGLAFLGPPDSLGRRSFTVEGRL